MNEDDEKPSGPLDPIADPAENLWKHGPAAVAMGMPVVIHPEVAKGEYSTATSENESGWAQQSEWHAPGQSFVTLWCAAYGNVVLFSHPTDPAAILDDYLADDDLEGIEDQGAGLFFVGFFMGWHL